jgi:predicted nucleic acid-binding protein
MRIIVSDSSCLIDFRKASLLEAFLGLPYEVIIPDTLFEDELLKFSKAEKKILLKGGLKVVEIPGDGVRRASELRSDFPRLSIHDCFAFALAEQNPGCILLTADGDLRSVAGQHNIEVHGILWALDEMYQATTVTAERIIQALELFETSPAIFRLPRREVRAFMKRYQTISS